MDPSPFLGMLGKIEEMEEVIDRIRADSWECEDLVFSAAIKTYAAHRLLNKAISLFRDLPGLICVNWTESFNAFLQIMIKESKLRTAHNLFLQSSHGWEVKFAHGGSVQDEAF